MATPRRITSYPNWMLDAANEIESGEERKIFVLSSPREAARYRQQFYGFRNAMERAKMFPMYPRFQTMRIEIRGNDLHIMTAEAFIPRPTEKK